MFLNSAFFKRFILRDRESRKDSNREGKGIIQSVQVAVHLSTRKRSYTLTFVCRGCIPRAFV